MANMIDFYRNLTQLMGTNTQTTAGPAHVDDSATTAQQFSAATYQEMRPNMENAVTSYNSRSQANPSKIKDPENPLIDYVKVFPFAGGAIAQKTENYYKDGSVEKTQVNSDGSEVRVTTFVDGSVETINIAVDGKVKIKFSDANGKVTERETTVDEYNNRPLIGVRVPAGGNVKNIEIIDYLGGSQQEIHTYYDGSTVTKTTMPDGKIIMTDILNGEKTQITIRDTDGTEQKFVRNGFGESAKTTKVDDFSEAPETEIPEFYYQGLRNGLEETVKATVKDLLPQVDILSDEFMEYFCNQNMEQTGEAMNENMVAAIKNLVTGSISEFTGEYVKTHKGKETFDMAAVAVEYSKFLDAKINEFSTKQVEANDLIDKIKNPDGKTLDSVSDALSEANQNGYITNAETKEIKDKATDYVLNGLINGDKNTETFLKALKPDFATNTNYTKAQNKLKEAKRFEDADNYVSAAAAYKEAKDLVAAFVNSVPTANITKGIVAVKTATVPPADPGTTPPPTDPKNPVADIKGYTDSLDKIAGDAQKKYDAQKDGDDKKAAKVLLDSINEYKENALKLAKTAGDAKTDKDKAALNEKLNGLKELVDEFNTQFNTILPGAGTGTPAFDAKKAADEVQKKFDDTKKTYDAMANGSSKIAAKAYLNNIEKAKNKALDMINNKAKYGLDTDAALQEALKGPNQFIDESITKINEFAGIKPGEDPGAIINGEITKAKENADVKKVTQDCEAFMTKYNQLTDAQKVANKAEFDLVKAVQDNYKKFDDKSLKTKEDVAANQKAITDKAKEVQAAKEKVQAIDTVPPPNPAQELAKAKTDAKKEVQTIKDDADKFIIEYNKLTDAQRTGLADAKKAADDVIANFNNIDKQTKTDEIDKLKTAITPQAKTITDSLKAAQDLVKANEAATGEVAALATAKTDAKKEVQAIKDDADKFIIAYDKLSQLGKSTLAKEKQIADAAIAHYNNIDKQTTTEDVNKTKKDINDLAATVKEGRRVAEALVTTQENIERNEALNNLKTAAQTATASIKDNAQAFLDAYKNLSLAEQNQLKAEKILAEQVVRDHKSIAAQGNEASVNTLKSNILGNADAVTKALDKVKGMANDNSIKEAIEAFDKDPVIQQVIKNINQFLKEYDALSDEQAKIPEALAAFKVIKSAAIDWATIVDGKFKDASEVKAIQKAMTTDAPKIQKALDDLRIQYPSPDDPKLILKNYRNSEEGKKALASYDTAIKDYNVLPDSVKNQKSVKEAYEKIKKADELIKKIKNDDFKNLSDARDGIQELNGLQSDIEKGQAFFTNALEADKLLKNEDIQNMIKRVNAIMDVWKTPIFIGVSLQPVFDKMTKMKEQMDILQSYDNKDEQKFKEALEGAENEWRKSFLETSFLIQGLKIKL